MSQKVGRREKLAQTVRRREIYCPVPPLLLQDMSCDNGKLGCVKKCYGFEVSTTILINMVSSRT